MSTLRVTTATASLSDEAFPDGPPLFTRTVEGDFRVTALVLEAEMRVCFVSCDCIVVTAAMAERAIERIAAEGLVPADNILICPTHTHHAFSTVDVLGLVSNREFVRRLEAAIVQSVQAAVAKLHDPDATHNDVQAELLFGMTQESTVGRNSRVLLKDGSIGWYGYQEEDVVRPTGPFDPDIPVLAFRRPFGDYAAIMYNRAVHNIGCLGEHAEVFSIGTYGLVAQEFERRHGTTALYFPGAIGSSHNVTYEGSGVPTDEAMVRLLDALERGLHDARPILFGPVTSIRRPFTYRVREFDDAAEDEKVARYARRYLQPHAESQIAVMRQQRAELSPHQGEERQAFLHAIRLGDIALVGVPCEYFARLGLNLRWRSPFQHTFIFGLANDDFGYVGDREGLELGGYQMWVSPHCPAAPGTGEAMVEQALGMLQELHDDRVDARATHAAQPTLRPLRPDDALALQRFYNQTSPQVRTWFNPLGWNASLQDCQDVCDAVARGERHDLVLDTGRDIVGWAFLSHLDQPLAYLGIGLTDAYCSQGLGKLLMQDLVDYARAHEYEGIELIFVQTNARARALYERFGFQITEPFTSADGREFFKAKLLF
jgi:ribosomal protein S18 acetylase RimI-like enzyme